MNTGCFLNCRHPDLPFGATCSSTNSLRPACMVSKATEVCRFEMKLGSRGCRHGSAASYGARFETGNERGPLPRG